MRKLILGIVLFLSACTTTHGTFTVMSNKIVDVKNFDINKAERIKNVDGSETSHIIIFIPTGVPTITGAMNDAFSKTDTDVMTDVTLKKRWFWIPYIYGQDSWIVTGDAVKTRSN